MRVATQSILVLGLLTGTAGWTSTYAQNPPFSPVNQNDPNLKQFKGGEKRSTEAKSGASVARGGPNEVRGSLAGRVYQEDSGQKPKKSSGAAK